MSKQKTQAETPDNEPESDVPGDVQPTAQAEPAWLADADYAGPLTADQAERRLSRHGHHVTKPAPATEAK